MSLDIIAAARAVGARFADTAFKAYVDPAKALNNRPCLLIGPPKLDRSLGTMRSIGVEWPVIALSSQPVGSLAALSELADLVALVDDVFGIETAVPTRYSLTGDGTTVAAYICTQTDLLDL